MSILPKTKYGQWSLWAFLELILWIGLFIVAMATGQRGGETFFSNIWLTIPFLLAYFSGFATFIFGAIAIFRQKERTILVFLISVIGFLIAIWGVMELAFLG